MLLNVSLNFKSNVQVTGSDNKLKCLSLGGCDSCKSKRITNSSSSRCTKAIYLCLFAHLEVNFTFLCYTSTIQVNLVRRNRKLN
jgi:hypothetical protein